MDGKANDCGEAPRGTLKVDVILEQLRSIRNTHLLFSGPVLLRNSKPVFISGAYEHVFYQDIFEQLNEMQAYLSFPSYKKQVPDKICKLMFFSSFKLSEDLKLRKTNKTVAIQKEF